MHARAKFMHQFSKNKLPLRFSNFFTKVSSVHSRITRNSSKINQYFIPHFRTSLLQRSIKLTGAKRWNSIPDNLKELNYVKFKTNTNNFYSLMIESYVSIFFFFYSLKQFNFTSYQLQYVHHNLNLNNS